MLPPRVNACLVVGGRYHDMDFARVELLKLLGEHAQVRTRVFEDYCNVEALLAADLLLTYTVDLVPDGAIAVQLRDWVSAGHRWFALHGTNSILEWSKAHKAWEAPRSAPVFMETIGSQFLAHPPITPYRVEVTEPDHPLVRGIEPFDADDELYLSAIHGPIRTLLHTRYAGDTPLFVDRDWNTDEPRPVMYLKSIGAGEVLYLTLGHARGQYDMQPLMAEYPEIERGSWKAPTFHELLRRGLRWAARLDAA